MKSYNKRELGRLLLQIQKDDLIICAELSRLGRNLFMIMEILNICMTKECRVDYKDNYRLGDDIKVRFLPLLLDYLLRLNVILLASARRRLWQEKKLKV